MSENVSAELVSVVTEENVSMFHGEISKLRGIEFPQTKGRSFHENLFHLYNWLHYDEEKDAAFCHVFMQAIESEILVTPWKADAFVTKRFRSWKKVLYIEKNKIGEIKTQNQSDSQKSAVERQIILVSKGYGKNMSKFSANEQRKNREILLKFLGKIYLL